MKSGEQSRERERERREEREREERARALYSTSHLSHTHLTHLTHLTPHRSAEGKAEVQKCRSAEVQIDATLAGTWHCAMLECAPDS